MTVTLNPSNPGRQSALLDTVQSSIAQPGGLTGNRAIAGSADGATHQLGQANQVTRRCCDDGRLSSRPALLIRLSFCWLIAFFHR